MSQSQYSTYQSSLGYNGEELEATILPFFLTTYNYPSFFQPPTTHLATLLSNYLYSQTILSSFDDHTFLQPDISPPPLPFTRVGPDRRKSYFLYDMAMHTEWVEWWLQTDYGRQSKIHWEAARQAPIWENFDQVAQIIDGAPKVMCKRCNRVLEHASSTCQNGYQGTSSMAKHLKTIVCKNSTRHREKITGFLRNKEDGLPALPTPATFTQLGWEEEILQFLTINRLPFHLIEHPTFHSLVHKAYSSPLPPTVPSANTIRRRLRGLGTDRQSSVLSLLPPSAKISIALDCWTSPFSQAFMAITGYFIDADWTYREVLLGFKPLSGPHSGLNLSSVLLNILQEHKIADRILGITTDTASNNKTMVDVIQQALPENVKTTRIPCLVNVIQLSLNQLLDRLKAAPLNETTQTKWTEKQATLAKDNAKGQKCEVSTTLNKLRYLAIYIHASPQRRDTFISLQTEEPKVIPIQDVRTRWNSTFLMLRRAKRLRAFFQPFCLEYGCEEMLLTPEEWRQIDYLLYLTEPFFEYTTELSKTQDVTIHLVFKLYNALFLHLEKSIEQLRQKQVPWKRHMLQCLEASRLKLDEYYAQTDSIPGHIFAVGTMLAPDNRFQFFQSDDWDKSWRLKYRSAFQTALSPYQEHLGHLSTTTSGTGTSLPTSKLSSKLNNMLRKNKPKAAGDEMTQYLDGESTKDVSLQSLPLHRIFFSIPATGAGVERLFNTARDICHYRRGRIKSETIEELMLFLCASRFDLEGQQRKELQQFFSSDEIEAEREQSGERLDVLDGDGTSDSEEQGNNEEQGTRLQGLVEVSEGEGAEEEAEEDTEAEGQEVLQLPEMTTQLRTSGRKRKSREDDECEHY
ncbi:hypothetical protein N7493_000040 [Penicillium malachiteum]|uniref:BED-type domain-containing protein n=1 Tax=Penicillium malachiteum TaxID=1324776 RepID=A0AAD6HVJ6_9EURO|nr:hypothetical protein N7493_000040 [Penicillium malachiteum]